MAQYVLAPFYGFTSGFAPGATSNAFFVSYAALPIGTTTRLGAVTPGFTNQGYVEALVVVPEPATALLAGGALAALALASRGRRVA